MRCAQGPVLATCGSPHPASSSLINLPLVLLVIFGLPLTAPCLRITSSSPPPSSHGQPQAAGHVHLLLSVLDFQMPLAALSLIMHIKNLTLNHTLEQLWPQFTLDTETLYSRFSGFFLKIENLWSWLTFRVCCFGACSCVHNHVRAGEPYVLFWIPLTLLRPAGQ